MNPLHPLDYAEVKDTPRYFRGLVTEKSSLCDIEPRVKREFTCDTTARVTVENKLVSRE